MKTYGLTEQGIADLRLLYQKSQQMVDEAQRLVRSTMGADRGTNYYSAIPVRNATGNAVHRGGVLEIANPTNVTATDGRRGLTLLKGIAPQTANLAKTMYGVPLAPITAGEVGTVAMQGVVQANIYVVDTDHEFCSPTNNQTGFMTSAESGLCRILEKEPGEGLVKGTILLQYGPAEAAPIRFRNESGETCPAYGVMRVTDYDESTNEFVVAKPSSSVDFQRFYLVNTGESVADDASGDGTWLEEADYVLTDGAASPGEQWGAADDSWQLVKNRYGFEIVGGDTTTSSQHRAMARQKIVVAVIGKADSAIAKDATGTVNVWVRDAATGAWEVSEFTIASVKALGSACSEDIYLAVEWKSGQWICGPMECSDATETATDSTSSFLFMGG